MYSRISIQMHWLNCPCASYKAIWIISNVISKRWILVYNRLTLRYFKAQNASIFYHFMWRFLWWRINPQDWGEVYNMISSSYPNVLLCINLMPSIFSYDSETWPLKSVNWVVNNSSSLTPHVSSQHHSSNHKSVKVTKNGSCVKNPLFMETHLFSYKCNLILDLWYTAL